MVLRAGTGVAGSALSGPTIRTLAFVRLRCHRSPATPHLELLPMRFSLPKARRSTLLPALQTAGPANITA